MLNFFALTLFVSATLLFWIQPMFTKMVLPLLGGSPAVWNTAMMFFQAALLLGYAYAHLSAKLLGVRRQPILQLGLLLVALLVLPVAVQEGWTPPAEGSPIPWLIGLMTVSLGLPFFALAASAPMLQMWVAHTRHPAAANPYVLYSSSNLGSILALLAYPVLAEPLMRLSQQSWAWSGTYAMLVLLTLGCAGLLWRHYDAGDAGGKGEAAGGSAATAPGETAGQAITWPRRLRWIALSFAPSSLLLGVTTFLSVRIAAVPLLWVVPLILYLLTFVIVFSRKPVLSHRLAVRLQPFFLVPLVIMMFWGGPGVAAPMFPVHLIVFFLLALVCHGELAASRPAPRHLTEFYLWMSVGGLLGGVFNALIAPQIFDRLHEYPLAIAVAVMLRPVIGARDRALPLWKDVVPAAVLGLVLVAIIEATGGKPSALGIYLFIFVSCAAGVALYAFRKRPVRLGLGVVALFLAGFTWGQGEDTLLVRERNFFGVTEVLRDNDGGSHVLKNGLTVHGAQSQLPGRRLEPLTYYARSGPVGQAMDALKEHLAGAEIAAVGLGAGSVACYATPGQRWTFYDIDPIVARIAQDPRYFTFLQDCTPDADIVLGDARLRLGEVPDGRYRLIILDAFSAASIPVHLITRQALEVYMAKLALDGVLLFHISNKHIDLQPLLGNAARELGLVGLFQDDSELSEADEALGKSPSHWALLAKRPAELVPFEGNERWVPLAEDPELGVWSDDFSNILRSFSF